MKCIATANGVVQEVQVLELANVLALMATTLRMIMLTDLAWARA